jgi:hypothetical protein
MCNFTSKTCPPLSPLVSGLDRLAEAQCTDLINLLLEAGCISDDICRAGKLVGELFVELTGLPGTDLCCFLRLPASYCLCPRQLGLVGRVLRPQGGLATLLTKLQC